MPSAFAAAKYQGEVMTVETSFDPFNFRHRHLGPSSDDIQRMLQVVGAPTLDALIDEAIPGDIRQRAVGSWSCAVRAAAIGEDARRGIAQQPDDLANRPRLLWHPSACRHPTQCARKSGLVHGLYALSAGDQPRPARGAAEFPDNDRRSDGARDCQCLAARRGDCCRGGHGDGAARRRNRRPRRSSSIAIAIRRRLPSCRPAPNRWVGM